jgi:hypothetical protein
MTSGDVNDDVADVNDDVADVNDDNADVNDDDADVNVVVAVVNDDDADVNVHVADVNIDAVDVTLDELTRRNHKTRSDAADRAPDPPRPPITAFRGAPSARAGCRSSSAAPGRPS